MNIFVIGSEGFIGSHCVDFFLKTNNAVSGADLFEQPARRYPYTKVSRLSPEFDEIFRMGKFDAVINAAGSGNVPYSMSHPLIDFEANCLDTIRVLDEIRKHQPGCRYIHLSSAAVYGNPQKLPVSENDRTLPLSPYGWHKLISENLCLEYSTLYQLRIAIVRPFSVYGPGLRKQLFWDLYQKTKGAIGEIELFGTGDESRDYIHVQDLVDGIAHILAKAPMEGEAYNLASGKETPISEVVARYFHALKMEQPYRFNGHVRKGDPLNWCADISRMQTLGFNAGKSLDSGLSELAQWIKSVRV